MAFVAKLQRDARSSARHAVGLGGTLRNADWRPFDVTVEDLSTDGFRVPTTAVLQVGSWISLGLPGIGARSAVVVRATEGGYGCQFAVPLADGEFARTLHASPDRPLPFPTAPAMERLASSPAQVTPSAEGLSNLSRLAILLVSATVCWAVVIGAWALLH